MPKDLVDAFSQLIDRIGGRQRAMIIGVGVVVAVVILAISRWATAPQWVPAFTNQPMEMVGQMTDKLQQAGIAYKLERGGSDIYVNATDVAKARVTLAKDGLPTSGRPGLELFDQPSWGMTDFTQRINYRRALEGELERTIGKMRGVQAAQVHLVLHEQSNFREQSKPASASVVLKTNDEQPENDVVKGIAHLVASSVDGLTASRVTVLDDAGRLLSDPNEEGSVAALTNAQLSTEREVENYLQTKAEGLLSDMVGPGNAKVRVNAALNFDKIDRQSQLLDPERQATSTEQRYEITPGAQGGAASSNVATSFDNSRVMETFSGSVGTIKRLSVAVLVNDKATYPKGQSPSDPDAKPTYTERSPAELARMTALVRSAVGADSGRGDIVTLVAARFDPASNTLFNASEKSDVWSRVETFKTPGIVVVALLALVAVLMMILRAIKAAPLALPDGGMALTAGSGSPVAGMLASGQNSEPSPDARPPVPVYSPISFPLQNDVRGKVTATIAAKPDVATRVVRAWLKEA